MFLTRLGFNSKMVVTGDITQIDLPQRPALRARGDRRHPQGRGGHRVRALRRRGRGAPQARAADRRGVQRVRREAGAGRSAARGASRAERPADPDRARAHRRARRSSGGPRSPRSPPPASRTGTWRSSWSTPRPIRALNREHRGRDSRHRRALLPGRRGRVRSAGPRELGDVVICPRAHDDLIEAVVHGVLHLCGHDHETDDGEMLALQRRVLDGAVTPLRLRGAGRAPERRQVDAGEPDRRRQGGDRLRQAADDAARDPRRGHGRGLAARAGGPARRAAPARPAHRAHAAPGGARARGLRRGAVRAERRAGDRRRRPLHRGRDQAGPACRP